MEEQTRALPKVFLGKEKTAERGLQAKAHNRKQMKEILSEHQTAVFMTSHSRNNRNRR